MVNAKNYNNMNISVRQFTADQPTVRYTLGDLAESKPMSIRFPIASHYEINSGLNFWINLWGILEQINPGGQGLDSWQCLLTLSCAYTSPEDLIELQILIPVPRWCPMLLVWGPHTFVSKQTDMSWKQITTTHDWDPMPIDFLTLPNQNPPCYQLPFTNTRLRRSLKFPSLQSNESTTICGPPAISPLLGWVVRSVRKYEAHFCG